MIIFLKSTLKIYFYNDKVEVNNSYLKKKNVK